MGRFALLVKNYKKLNCYCPQLCCLFFLTYMMLLFSRLLLLVSELEKFSIWEFETSTVQCAPGPLVSTKHPASMSVEKIGKAAHQAWRLI